MGKTDVVVYNGPGKDGYTIAGGLRHCVSVSDYDGTEAWMVKFKETYYDTFSASQSDVFMVCQGRDERNMLMQNISKRFDTTYAAFMQKGDNMNSVIDTSTGMLKAMLVGDTEYPGIDITYYPNDKSRLGSGILVEAPTVSEYHRNIRMLVYGDDSDEPEHIIVLGKTVGDTMPSVKDCVITVADLTAEPGHKSDVGLVQSIVGGWLVCTPVVLWNNPGYRIEVVRDPKTWDNFSVDEWMLRPTATVVVGSEGNIRLLYESDLHFMNIGHV